MAKDSLDKARKEINEIDKEMAELFVRRMRAAESVAEYKKQRGLAILDEDREREVIRRNSLLIEDDEIRDYYVKFLRNTMSVSREYQHHLIGPTDIPSESSFKRLHVAIGERGYDVNIGRGLIDRAGELFNLDRRVIIVTDEGVPAEYSERVKVACKIAEIITFPDGEGTKSPECFTRLCEKMVNMGMTRSDCVVAVGGGVVGDLAGFAAASYMRGIDFYNIPTTLLSQVDSSIGGKTAINLGGVKNIVGAFYQPKGVIIDPDLLETLPKRQLNSGLCEAIKMSLTSDEELFRLIEGGNIDENIEEIIIKSLIIKRSVVEADERESDIRRILNFGHTFGHAVEAQEDMGGLYHGECVAIGMTVCVSDEVRSRLIPLLNSVGLPTKYEGDLEAALKFISHDKKCEGERISVVFVDKIGSYRIEKMDVEEFLSHVREEIKK